MHHLFVSRFAALVLALLFVQPLVAQRSVAREWEEVLLQTMKEDLARPHVQARNFFHFSIAMYDAWAVYDNEASTYLLGKTVGGFNCPFIGIPKPANVEAARREAMSFAAYRLLSARYVRSPSGAGAVYRFRETLKTLGYDFSNNSIDYHSGSPAALGNYLAQSILQMGELDGSNEGGNYVDQAYQPVNPPLEVAKPGADKFADPNHWQPLKLNRAIDLDGYPVLECRCMGRPFASLIDSLDKNGHRLFTGTQTFQGSQWGQVKPFALKKEDQKSMQRDGREFRLYKDPGADFLPQLDTLNGGGSSAEYRWNYMLVAAWSALLNPRDTTHWDISPGSMGNVSGYPQNLAELHDFYDLKTGRDPGAGHAANPRTEQPYAPQRVPRSDYIRSAVQYWAEGPDAETTTGTWVTLLNYISDRPGLVKKFNGKGRTMSDLEWDVKSYFLLGGALHDASVAAWSLKSWYDGVRPITALRYMAAHGQSSAPKRPSYDPAGIPLLPGHIELIRKGDPLAGRKNAHLGKIKIYAWNGPFSVTDAATETAGTGWILAENWFPYQQKTFVTPPYGGFVSGHAALSHSAAEALTLLTGDAFFPGGLGEFTVYANNQFLRVEQGPGVDVKLQWATYRDAADQASLSRVWAGLNAPFDDIPGRRIGIETGAGAFELAKTYFYRDRDHDGYMSFEDCDDNNAAVHPGARELCDGLDNDCNGLIDDVTPPCGGGKQ